MSRPEEGPAYHLAKLEIAAAGFAGIGIERGRHFVAIAGGSRLPSM